MKIPGTNLDLPLPDGWKAEVIDTNLILSGRQPDSEWYRDRSITVTFDIVDGNLEMWRAKAQIYETRMRQKFTSDSNYRRVATGKWVRSHSRRKINNMHAVFCMANGWTL